MSMFRNSRYCGRNKLKYVTYKCSGRVQQRKCNTKEFNKTYLENFVLEALYNQLFSYNSIRKLTQRLNQYKSEIHERNEKEFETATTKLTEVNEEISKTLEVFCLVQLERGQRNLSISTLESISKTLETPLSSLLCNLTEEEHVTCIWKQKTENLFTKEKETLLKVLEMVLDLAITRQS